MVTIQIEENFLWIGVMIVVGIVFILVFYYFGAKAAILRELKKSKSIPITRIKEGEYAKVIGIAKLVKDPIIAPISGRNCVFYQIIVEKKGGKNSWHTVIDETQTQDFFIENRGEMAIVKTDQPKDFRKIFLEKDHKASSGFWNDANHRLEKYLKRHDRTSQGFLGINKTLRYHEGIIETGETIAVKGIGNWTTLKEPIAGFNYSKVLTLTGSKDKKLLITDLKKATKESS
jgi:hypothetical protein